VTAARAAALATLLAAARATAAAPSPACPPAAPLPGPGSADPFRAPDARATALNSAAKTLYRQGRWEEARAQYRAAAAADPEFLAPRLNVACSFVRQDRFGEATAEALALIDRAYVPWAREVLEAADLGALKPRPEMVQLQRGIAAAAARWGAGLDGALVFVARQRAPLRVPPEGEGVFILNPHQEAWAFSPETGRYRQLTAEDGHVLAIAVSPDGRRVAYATADKLVRGAGAGAVALRGVAVRELTLATMAAAPPARIAGDVRRLEIAAGAGAGPFLVRVDGDGDGARGTFALEAEGALAARPARAWPSRALAVLTGHGAAAAGERRFGGGACALAAHEARGTDGAPAIVVGAAGKKGAPIQAGAGAGLAGLPIP
jgi:hypothetical protein